MKKGGVVFVVLAALVSGAVASDEFKGRVFINSIQKVFGENSAGEDTESLKISTSQSSPKFRTTIVCLY